MKEQTSLSLTDRNIMVAVFHLGTPVSEHAQHQGTHLNGMQPLFMFSVAPVFDKSRFHIKKGL